MRLTIIVPDNMIAIDGETYWNCDLTWIPKFFGELTQTEQSVHAVQWGWNNEEKGHIELVTGDPNIQITELGIFEQAISFWQARKEQVQIEEAERIRLMEEERARQEEYLSEEDLDAIIDQLQSDTTV